MELFNGTVLKTIIYTLSATSVLIVIIILHQYYPIIWDEKNTSIFILNLRGKVDWWLHINLLKSMQIITLGPFFLQNKQKNIFNENI